MRAENFRYTGQIVNAITTAQLRGARKSSDIQNRKNNENGCQSDASRKSHLNDV